MPYIKQTDRRELLSGEKSPSTPGELNYLVTILAKAYLEASPGNYQAYNDVLGALEGAKLELYRRRISTYEDKKIIENGDV